ncbi:M15 family metallopeptidase [Gracilibacillus kekensis]|uniref:D-alanyl-D-alanine carboxypeptidase n=1 Tax=Gracilibacillus kekensis TaxID=1027249 RepID=A0A1M7J696_9BACI|nr:M15 family metallopeptidase [Gracilibacillus kekensis]SHM48472.1 D-alanyl-D-alanine carboxypeptidase [Gracilibacillus kekensis]
MKKIAILFILMVFVTLISCQQESYSTEKQDKRNYQAEHKKEPNTALVNAGVDEETDEGETSEQDTPNQSDQENDTAEQEDGLKVIDNPTSVELVVNKQRKLPDGYEPGDLVDANVPYHPSAGEGNPKRLLRQVAADALEELFQAAEADGLDLIAVSGYRSAQRQKQLYENSVAKNGQEHADKFSAKPGTSEHQTGLAMDVASAALVAVLEQSFIETDEGKWLEDNAHKYGFIIRYPEGKEEITGYGYEPWHLRYVGEEMATEIYQAQTTLEEYFGLYP